MIETQKGTIHTFFSLCDTGWSKNTSYKANSYYVTSIIHPSHVGSIYLKKGKHIMPMFIIKTKCHMRY